MADALASGASGGDPVEVQVLSAAPSFLERNEVFLMDDYQLFEEFLTNEELFFKADKFPNGTPFFRIPQKIKNGSLVDIFVVFEEENVKVLFLKIATVEDDEKLPVFYELFNDLNRNYKFFTFNLNSDNEVVLEGNLPTDLRDGEFQPESLFGYIIAALKTLSDVYPKIMKVIWAD